jgi:hypothetical protein
MHCPECGSEYREGVTVCADCGVTLTHDPPLVPPEPEAGWVDLETVLESSDPALLAVARSLLDAEGIPCFARGELIQDFLGWGRLPSGTNFITGPVQLQVASDRSAEARELLAAADTASFEMPADEPAED